MKHAVRAEGVTRADRTTTDAESIATQLPARFDALRPRLTAVCAAVVGRDDAVDVVHETFLRAQDRIHQLRDPELFDAWVVRIALNEAKSVVRRRQTGAARLRELRPRPTDPPDLGIVELVELLPPRDRAVIVLHYGYGYRMSEIARLLALTEVNVRTIAFRARRTLRAQLEEDDR